MVFSSLLFLFGFLPFVLMGSFWLHNKMKWQNLFLFLSSILFYAWGEPRFVFVMLFSVFWNWRMALVLENCEENKIRNFFLILTVTLDVGILFVFKYMNFSFSMLNAFLETGIEIPKIALPIGISFFTFQGLSYVIDVWKRDTGAEHNILNVGLYIAFFPQLIAGPIVRYLDIKEELANRKSTWEGLESGISRFLSGFSKKVLLANNLALLSDKAFLLNTDSGGLNPIFAWGGQFRIVFRFFMISADIRIWPLVWDVCLDFIFKKTLTIPM